MKNQFLVSQLVDHLAVKSKCLTQSFQTTLFANGGNLSSFFIKILHLNSIVKIYSHLKWYTIELPN